MAISMNLNVYLMLLMFIKLDIAVSAPVQKVITNHCDGQDCEINIQYHDDNRDLSLKTNNTDSVSSALLDITIKHSSNSNQNGLVSLMGNVVQMLSYMVQAQQKNHQQLNNMFQQPDMDSQLELLDFLQTSTEAEVTPRHGAVTTQQPVITTSQDPVITTTQGPVITTQVFMQDCSTAPSSGQYSISPSYALLNPFLVVCEVDPYSLSGRWIVIQRRFNGSVDFDRNWVDYENGFGSLDGEFWLGLSKMHTITSHGTWKLRFDLEDFDGNHAFAEYGFFQVGDSASNYRLTIGSYSGDAGDAMTGLHNLNEMAFTTKDRDNDEWDSNNCGIFRRSGWWHRVYSYSVVTGLYRGPDVIDNKGMSWYQLKNSWEVLKKTEMKIKRID